MRPLEGTTVLDIAWHGPGVITAWLLAGMGARVIKVEPPDGSDFVRTFGPRVGAHTLGQMAFDRGKESLAIDLRRPEGVAALLKVAATADVVIEGFRPGVADRLGIGYSTLSAQCPALVYCAVSGFPRASALANAAAHDLNYLAESGLMALVHADGSVNVPPVQIADYIGATMAALAVVSGCLQAARTGVGMQCEASLYDAARFSGVLSILHSRAGGDDDALIGTQLAGSLACYGLYQCRDGRTLAVAALESKFWSRLCELTGLPELIAQQMNMADQEAIKDRLAERLFEKTLEEWMEIFAGEDVCVAAVRSLSEVEAPARTSREKDPAPDYPIVAPGTADHLGAPPRLGEHTRSVLVSAGLSGADVDALHAGGVVNAG